jgi:hypothetical protein
VSRISIDVTDAQHQKLKALAALQGLSIKEFVLARTIGDADLAELEELLDKRLQNARAGGTSKRTLGDVFDQVRRETAGREPHA